MSVDVDALDVEPLCAAIDKLAAAAERSAAYPRPDDAMQLRNAANWAGIEFVKFMPGTDWGGITPVPAMGGSPERMSGIAVVFGVLKACQVTYPNRPMPPSGWIAAELRAALADLAPTQRCKEASTGGTADDSLTEEEAAILKVLLQANGVTLTIEHIEGKVTLGEKTIRKIVTHLIDRGLLARPRPKKGCALTAKGRARAKSLSANDGAKLLRAGVGR